MPRPVRIISFNANGLRSAASKGFFDWFRAQDADVLCVQETKAQEHQLGRRGVPARRLPGLVPRREHQEGLQRRGDLQPARARRGAHRDGLGAVRRGRPLHRGALRQPQRGLVLHPVRLVGRAAPGLQVRGDGVAQAASWTNGCASGRDYVLCGDWNIVRTPARHQELDQRTRRTPAACRPSATGSTACAWIRGDRRRRLGRRLPRAARRRPGLHLVEQPRRRARQQRRLAHRLPVRDARRCASACGPARSTRRRASPTTPRSSSTMTL